MNSQSFELIQVALCTRNTLSKVPSAQEWEQLYIFAQKQSIVGIVFSGIQRLADQGQISNLPAPLKMQWIVSVVQIQQKNKAIEVRCKEMSELIGKDGYECCLLKGEAFANMYPSPLNQCRQSGDIDMWMIAEPKDAIEWARRTGKMHYYDYHHADINIFSETEVELHYRPSISRNLIRNARLQKWFKGEGKEHIVFNETLGCRVPDNVFSVILALNHNFWHLLYEGVGLRQLMDLYFILQHVKEADKSRIRELISYFKLERFASSSAWVLWHVFDNEREDSILIDEASPLPSPDSRSGKFLLDEILQAGNFGHHDTRLKSVNKGNKLQLMFLWIKHTFRLIRYYPSDVLWTPIGILRISLWRRIRHIKEDVN